MLDKVRARPRGIAVNPEAIRRARQESGLSLAQVAGNRVSRATVHMVESGRMRPSLQTLQHIARRTGKPLSYFLSDTRPDEPAARRLEDLRERLEELERLTLRREFRAAAELAAAILPLASDVETEAAVRFHLGQAHARLVDPEQALPHLRAARRFYEEACDPWMVVECLDWEAAALALQEDPFALALAMDALGRCRQLDPLPPATHARILGHIASIHVARNSWKQAVRFYAEAVEAAGEVRDLLQMAKMYDGLALAYQRLQQPPRAVLYANRALALYSLESDLSSLYRAENNLGDLLLQQGDLDEAERHLLRALAGCTELRVDRRGRAYVLLNLAELNLARGRAGEARDLVEQAREAAEAVGDRTVAGLALSLLGRLHEEAGDLDAADRSFAAALALFEDLRLPQHLRDCHMQYAQLLNAREDFRGAACHWQAAAEIGRELTVTAAPPLDAPIEQAYAGTG